MSTITHSDMYTLTVEGKIEILSKNRVSIRTDSRSDIEDIREQCSVQLASSSPVGDPAIVIRAACAHFGCDKAELLTKGRTRAQSERRFHVYRILYNWPLSYHEVGRMMMVNGKPRDHGTIMHGLRQHKELLKQAPGFRADYEALLGKVGQLLKREVQK